MRQDRELPGEWQRQGYRAIYFPPANGDKRTPVLSSFIDWLWKHTSYKKRLDEEKEESWQKDS